MNASSQVMASSTQSFLSPYELLYQGLQQIPISHYVIGFIVLFVVYCYKFLECHIIHDIVTGFRGQSVALTFNSKSQVYDEVVSKCRTLNERYLVTPWLASPHLQTMFLSYFGNPPTFNYRRQIFNAPDGGTLALDWLRSSDVNGGNPDNTGHKDDGTPIVVLVPGLTSESKDTYLRHIVYNTAKCGWNAVVINHRGLGGVPITSDCFYDAVRTEDVRTVVRHLHSEYPDVPLYGIGCSIGASVLSKYLGQEGKGTPIAGAVAICSPYDFKVSDVALKRKVLPTLYDQVLASRLREFAHLHEERYSRFVNWEEVDKARSIREFNESATAIVGKYGTGDAYYRQCNSCDDLMNVAVPLLCITALDDPVCSYEAIPWEECRRNKNIVLATTQHGGHLGFFEGLTASRLWWVRAANEFLMTLHSNQHMHVQQKVMEDKFMTKEIQKNEELEENVGLLNPLHK